MLMKNIKKLSDEKVVEIVIKKDKQAYEELVGRYEKKLLRYAKRLIGNEHDADDIVQDSFIKAYVNLKGFDTKRRFSSWIYRIVHNEAINKIKSKKRFLSLEFPSFSKKLSYTEDHIEKMNKKSIKKLINKSLSKLDIKYKDPLVLYFLEEKSYEEISDILRIPLNTVGTRISRGKKMLAIIVNNIEGDTYGKNK